MPTGLMHTVFPSWVPAASARLPAPRPASTCERCRSALREYFDRQAAVARVTYDENDEKISGVVVIYLAGRMGLAGTGPDVPGGRSDDHRQRRHRAHQTRRSRPQNHLFRRLCPDGKRKKMDTRTRNETSGRFRREVAGHLSG